MAPVAPRQSEKSRLPCRWLARYGPEPKPPPAWKRWELWQYSDGNLGPEPHEVAGISPCDRDRFNGSAAELRALWGYPAPAMV